MLFSFNKGELVIATTKKLLSGGLLLIYGTSWMCAQIFQANGSESVGITLTEAQASIEHQQWKIAETQLRRYLVEHTDSPEAMYALALTLFHENRPNDSLAMYTRAAASRQPGAEEFHCIALDYVLLHGYVEADTWITLAAREDPHNGEIAYAMGRIKYTENRFDEAVTSFERALELMPRSVKIENNLGLTFEGLNEADKAIEMYQQAIAWQTSEPHPSEQPLLNLGILLTDLNDLGKALPLLQQAETLAPGNGKVHAALGKLYARQMNLPEAQRELEQAVKMEPNDAGLHFQLGQVYRKRGWQDKAREELVRASALQGTHFTDDRGVN